LSLDENKIKKQRIFCWSPKVSRDHRRTGPNLEKECSQLIISKQFEMITIKFMWSMCLMSYGFRCRLTILALSPRQSFI
ncbi:unnamed protein product, partial [Arabidopsis halleri]